MIYVVAIIIGIVVLALCMMNPISDYEINWAPSPGKFSKDGLKINMGPGKWEEVSFTLDGKEYDNPLTGDTEPIPGVINDDNTKVYNGTTWELVTLSPDGKKYLNPITLKYAPVELVRTDKFGRDWQWNLFTSRWMGF